MKKFKQFLKGLLFLTYFLLGPSFFAAFFIKELNSSNKLIQNITSLGIYLLIFFTIIFVIRKDLWQQTKNFFQNPKPIFDKGITYWIYGFIVMIISNLIIYQILGNIPANEQSVREGLLGNPLTIPTIIFFGPFLEEIIFRYNFKNAFNNKILYALWSAFIFGGLHVLSAFNTFTLSDILSHLGEFLFLIPYGSLGFFFAKAYYETKNIYSSIVPHIIHNTISVILIFLFR